MDLLKEAGFKFFGMYDIVHTVGQDRSPSLFDIIVSVLEAFKYYTGRHESLFSYFITNQLIEPCILDDNSRVFRFKRFIGKKGGIKAGAQGLNDQLHPSVLKELKKKGGFMIIHNHLGDNLGPPDYFSEDTKKALERLSREFHEGHILVTTTSRLLKYNYVVRFLNWSYRTENDTIYIEIEGVKDPVNGFLKPPQEDFQGITFYTPDTSRTVVLLYGKRQENIRCNPPDERGKTSVSIPWIRLQFPKKWRKSTRGSMQYEALETS